MQRGDYAAVAVWVMIAFGLAAFWAGVGWGIHEALAGNPKPDPPHVVCDESYPPKPHIGTAIICHSEP
ncbi:MAG TPA: hypothetical protein VGF24_37155 [Vicinamibacterales bacterium]|jgi:hypothetical protein